jgi:hypothetical protein
MKINANIDLGNLLVGIIATAGYISSHKVHRNVKTKNGRTIGQVVDSLGDSDDIAVSRREQEPTSEPDSDG